MGRRPLACAADRLLVGAATGAARRVPVAEVAMRGPLLGVRQRSMSHMCFCHRRQDRRGRMTARAAVATMPAVKQRTEG
jgi:hypothetical protein